MIQYIIQKRGNPMKKSILTLALAAIALTTGCQTLNTKVFKSANSMNPNSIHNYPTIHHAYKAYNLFRGADKDGNPYYADSFQYRGKSTDVQLFTNYDSYQIPVKIAYNFCKYREQGNLQRYELLASQQYYNRAPYTERGFYVCVDRNQDITWGVKIDIDRTRSNSEFVHIQQTVFNSDAVQFAIKRDRATLNKAYDRNYRDPALERMDYETYGK